MRWSAESDPRAESSACKESSFNGGIGNFVFQATAKRKLLPPNKITGNAFQQRECVHDLSVSTARGRLRVNRTSLAYAVLLKTFVT